jgi:starch-binding outer membrane protein SusE/F
MKKIIQQLLTLTVMVAVFSSCKKDENQVIYQGGTEPVFSANRTGTIPMSFPTRADEAVKLMWTNPNYTFNTGGSSQDVTYTIEIDTAGANFSSPNIKREAVAKELSVTFTQEKMNDFLLNQLVLTPNRTYNVEMRVISTLFNNNARLVSNTLSFAITPYAIPPKVTPPGTPPDFLDGKLFMVGNATPGGWNNPVPTPTQEFTRISATMYELVLPITGGNFYLMLPVNGSWAAKYGGVGPNNGDNNPDGDDFKAGGSDLKAPVSSGNYKLVVDFQRGKYTMTPQ